MTALLAPERDVLAPTLPGSDGGVPLDLRNRPMLTAYADHVEELLDAVGWKEPVQIVGSSFGGVTAMELATRGRAGNVIALAPPWVVGPGMAWYLALFGMSLPALRLTEPLHARVPSWPRAFAIALHGSLKPAALPTDDAIAMGRSMGRFPVVGTALAAVKAGDLGPGMPMTERIAAPVTLAWGTRDILAPRWMMQRWQDAIPAARVEILEGFPHIPHLRDPVRIAELIRDT